MMKIPRLTLSVAALALGITAAGLTHTTLRPAKEVKNLASTMDSSKIPARLSATFESNREKALRGPRRVQEPTFDPTLPVIYGAVVSSYADWFIVNDQEQVGVYAFQPESPVKFQPICLDANLMIVGGGAYDGKYLYYHLWEMYADETSELGITFHNYYCVVDPQRWDMVKYVDYSDNQNNIAYDMTVDPTDGTLYAMQWGPYEDKYCELARVNKMTGESEGIAKVPQMTVLASDNFGRLYSVDYNGDTYYVDKNTGKCVKIGNSGWVPAYVQSAAVDPESNTIYWAAYGENGSGLYKLNTISGRAEKVSDMPGSEEVTSLFFDSQRKGLDAPDEVSDYYMTWSDGTLTLKATAPQKAFNGSALSGDVTIEFYIDGSLASSGKCAPGAEITLSGAAAAGDHTVVIVASNAAGRGPKTYVSQHGGEDVPGPVENLLFTLDGNRASLTWSAPRMGLNGGTVDPAEITYTVKRYPGGEVVAENISETTFSETLPDNVTATYYYTVTGTNKLGEGATATSNTNLKGASFTIPYSNDFETEESTAGFTIINSEEERGWYWWHNTALNYKAMASRYSKKDASDNWLILPALEFEGGKKYKLTFDSWVFDDESPEKFEVKMGNDATPAAQTVTLMYPATVMNTDVKHYELTFTPAESGKKNVSFHCLSPVSAYYLMIDNIEIAESTGEDPEPEPEVLTPLAPTDINLSYNEEDGSLSLKWKAPTGSKEGKDLDQSKLSYTVYRSDGTLVAKDLKDTQLVDTELASVTTQRMVYYQVVPYYAGTEGELAIGDFVIIGDVYIDGLQESFSNQGLDTTPWVLSRLTNHTTSLWSLSSHSSNPDATPQDEDGGMATFVSMDKDSGLRERMTSAKVDLSQMLYPTLKFWVYQTTASCSEKLDIQVTHNDNVFTTIATVPLHGDATGWKEFEVRIPTIHCQPVTMVAFEGTTARGFNINLDNITLETGDPVEGLDLEAVTLEVPDLMPDQEGELKFYVSNNGSEPASNFEVSLLESGHTVIKSTCDETLAPGEEMYFIFKVHPEQSDLNVTFRFSARVKAEGDVDSSNDETEWVDRTVGVSGVIGIAPDPLAADDLCEVYTLDGRSVVKSIKASELSRLDAGIYILRTPKRTMKMVIR